MSRKWWNSFKELFVLVCFLAGMLQLRKFSTQLLIDFHFFGINLPVVCGDLRHPFGTASDLGRPHKKGKSTNTSGSNMSGTINEKNILFMLLFFFSETYAKQQKSTVALSIT